MEEILVYLSLVHDGDWDKIYSDINNKVAVDKKVMSEKLSDLKCKYVTILNPNYPTQLKYIFKPPFVLFYKGDLNLFKTNKLLAVIGSRENSEYGKFVTKHICERLVKNRDIAIVSGLAKGIDSIAHETCLETGGKTIAVVGNGLDVVYPKENLQLYKDIEEKGLLISEYPPNVAPLKEHFPARNRIISGLCDAVVVTEAQIKSGTMNTVAHALEDGKQIFCVPDKANLNSGCNKLIKEGATLVESADDILDELL